MAGYILREDQPNIVLPAQQADRLIGRGDGDAALLYLCLLRADRGVTAQELQRRLKWSQLRLHAAETALQELGLIDRPPEQKPPEPAQERPVYTADDLTDLLTGDAGFRMLVPQTEEKLGKRLKTADLQILAGLYDDLGLPADVIYLLVCHCVARSEERYGPGRRPTLRQIEKEGYHWAQRGLFDQESASRYLRDWNVRRSAMSRYMQVLGLDERYIHLYVNWNVLMVNYSDELHSFTKFQRCERHGISLATIAKVSRLTWTAIREDFSLVQYEKALDDIHDAPRGFTPWQVAIGGGFACGGFCIQFGCDWTAFFYCSLAAILGFRLRMFLPTMGCNNYVAIGISAFVATLLAWATALLSTDPAMMAGMPSWMISTTPWHPLMACALFIVPGVPLINFVSDMLDGYIETGFIRAVNTLLMVLAMAFGIAFAIKVCGIDNFAKTLTMTPHHEYWEYAIAAAVSAMGFSTIFNIPRRLLPVVAVGGIIAVCVRNFINLGPSNGNLGLDMGLTIGSLAGATAVSIAVIKARHWFHVPHQCITIPSVIPMIPGVLMYRALFAFIEMHGVVGEVTVGMNNAIKASLAIICIALGVAVPNLFFRRFIEDTRKRKLLAMLVERKKRNGEFVTPHAVGVRQGAHRRTRKEKNHARDTHE